MTWTFPAAPAIETKYEIEYRENAAGKGRYYLNGKPAKRVTSILDKFPDSGRGLIEWSKKRVTLTAKRLLRDRVKPHPATGALMCYFPEAEIDALMSEALKNPDRIAEETADVGTDVHAFIDEWLQAGATDEAYKAICTKHCLPENPVLLEVLQRQTETMEMDDYARNRFYDQMKGYMFARFVKFWRKSGLAFVGSEILVGSQKYGYCGRLDILARDKKGRLVLLDLKTSKWISPSYFSQVAAYGIAYEEMTGEKIGKYAIVQCPREFTEMNQGFGIYPVKVAKYKQIFLNILRYWKETEFSAACCRTEALS